MNDLEKRVREIRGETQEKRIRAEIARDGYRATRMEGRIEALDRVLDLISELESATGE